MRYLVALSLLALSLTGLSAHAATTGSIRILSTVAQGTAQPSDFTLEIRSNGSRISASGNTIIFGGLAAGPVTIAHTGGPAGYRVVWGGACAPSGTVTVVAGETRECTATYVLGRSGALKVDTTIVGGPAVIGATGIELRKDGSLVYAGTGASQTIPGLAAGGYVLSAVPLTNYTVSLSGACSTQGALTILANQTVTCTVVYTYRAPGTPDSRTDRTTTPRPGR